MIVFSLRPSADFLIFPLSECSVVKPSSTNFPAPTRRSTGPVGGPAAKSSCTASTTCGSSQAPHQNHLQARPTEIFRINPYFSLLMHSSSPRCTASSRLSFSPAGMTCAIVFHLLALGLLMAFEAPRHSWVDELPPVQVFNIIPPVPPAPPVVKLEETRPDVLPRVELPVRKATTPIIRPKRPAPPPPVLAVAANAHDLPDSQAVSPPEPAPAPTAAEISSAPAQSGATHGSTEGTITAARFDADYLSNPAPAYPSLSRRLGEQGKVVLRVLVSAVGQAQQVELKTGSGFPRLDQSAQDAVRRWRFVPARRGNDAVAAWVQVPIVFDLKD